jgi:hypothetical protein
VKIVLIALAVAGSGALLRAQGGGALKVSSFPSGAKVSVDGVDTGKVTPMSVSLPAGDHVVVVAIPGSGWNAVSRTVRIASGNNELNVVLLPSANVGPQGPPGPAGPQGLTGPPGETGSQGVTGAQGPAGVNGTNGTDGEDGVDGAAGVSVTFVDYFSGAEYLGAATGCANGGAVYAAGNPPVNTYVCNGTDGAPGETGATGSTGPAGPPGPASGGATMLNLELQNGTTEDVEVPLGPVTTVTLRFSCSGPATHRLFTLAAPAGVGGVQVTGTKTIDDSPGTTIPYATGAGLPTGAFLAIGVNNPNPNNTSGHFYRMGGTMVLHSALGVTTVVFDMFLENRSNLGTCAFRGTAVASN